MAAHRGRGSLVGRAAALGDARQLLARRDWLRARGLPVLIVTIALVKGILWTQLLPPWYGPDEVAHFGYTQALALTGRIPPGAAGRADGRDVAPEIECSLHNLGFRSNGPFAAEPPYVPDPTRCRVPTGRGMLPAVPTNPAGAYGPAYYAMALPFWAAAASAPVETRLEAVRLLSVLLGVVAALCCYLAAFWAFAGDRRLAATAAAVFTLQPMLSQQTAVATNDALVIAAGAMFFWRLFRALRRPPTPTDMAALGGLVGLAFMAKPQGAVLAILVPAALLPELVAGRFGARPMGVAARRLLLAAAVAAVTAAVGLLIQLALHGSPIPVAPPPIAGHHDLRDYVHMLRANGGVYPGFVFLFTFWGEFAWTAVALPPAAYQAICAVLAAAAAGLVWIFARRRDARLWIGVSVASVAVVAAALLAAEALTFVRGGGQLLQGRDLLLALSPLVVAVVAGLVLPAPERHRGTVAAWVCAAAVALQLVSWGVLLEALFS